MDAPDLARRRLASDTKCLKDSIHYYVVVSFRAAQSHLTLWLTDNQGIMTATKERNLGTSH